MLHVTVSDWQVEPCATIGFWYAVIESQFDTIVPSSSSQSDDDLHSYVFLKQRTGNHKWAFRLFISTLVDEYNLYGKTFQVLYGELEII